MRRCQPDPQLPATTPHTAERRAQPRRGPGRSRARTSNRVCAHQSGVRSTDTAFLGDRQKARGVQQVVGRVGASAAALLRAVTPARRSAIDGVGLAATPPARRVRRRLIATGRAAPVGSPDAPPGPQRTYGPGVSRERGRMSGERTPDRVCAHQIGCALNGHRLPRRPAEAQDVQQVVGRVGATAALLPPRGHAGSAVGDRQPRTRRGGAGPVAARGADGPRPRFGKTSTRRVARPTVDPCPSRRPAGVSGRARRFLPRPTTATAGAAAPAQLTPAQCGPNGRRVAARCRAPAGSAHTGPGTAALSRRRCPTAGRR